MKIQEHLDKISWSFADKILFILYGLVQIVQINYLEADEFGLYLLLINLSTWMFVISDSMALQNLIQFGINERNRKKVNLYALMLHSGFVIGISLLILALQWPLAGLFGQSRFSEVASMLPLLTLSMIPRTFGIKLLYRDYRFREVFFLNLIFFGIMSAITFYLILTQEMLDYYDLIVIYVSGAVLSSLAAVIFTKKELKFSTKGEISIKDLISFGMPLTLQAAFHSIPRNLDVYLIQYTFGLTTVGIYGSAKTLFRVFDEAVNASVGLIYPSAVRQLDKGNKQALTDLITKSVSFMLFAFAAAVVILEAGGTRFIITTFLPERFADAMPIFNLLILSAFFLPFVSLSSIINAMKRPMAVVFYIIISVAASIGTFLIVGQLGTPALTPLGLIAYYSILGTMLYIFVKRNLGFPFFMIFRAIKDTFYFLKSKFLLISRK